jgi:chromosome segregation ATPase
MTENKLPNTNNIMTQLQIQMDYVQISKIEYDTLRTENIQLKTERDKYYEKLQQTINNHTVEREKLNKDIFELHIENKDLHEQVDQLKKENTDLHKQVDQLKKDNTELHEQIRLLKEENKSLKSEITELKSEITKLNKQLDKVNEKLKQLEFNLDDKKFRIDALEKDNRDKNEKISNLEKDFMIMRKNMMEQQQKEKDRNNLMVSAEICKFFRKTIIDYVFNEEDYCDSRNEEYSIEYANLVKNNLPLNPEQKTRWLSIEKDFSKKDGAMMHMNKCLQSFIQFRNLEAHPIPKTATLGELKIIFDNCITYFGGDQQEQKKYKIAIDFVIKKLRDIKGEQPLKDPEFEYE